MNNCKDCGGRLYTIHPDDCPKARNPRSGAATHILTERCEWCGKDWVNDDTIVSVCATLGIPVPDCIKENLN